MFMDPTQIGKEYFTQMESLFVEKFNELARDPDFLSNINQGILSGIDSKKSADTAMKNCLESLNMPTRDDLARVLQYLVKIESRIVGLEERIEDLTDEMSKSVKGTTVVQKVEESPEKSEPAKKRTCNRSASKKLQSPEVVKSKETSKVPSKAVKSTVKSASKTTSKETSKKASKIGDAKKKLAGKKASA